MEKRDYAVGFGVGNAMTELTRPGRGCCVEHAAVELFHCRCDSKVWAWDEQAGDS